LISYKDAGVDIDKGNRLVEFIKKALGDQRDPNLLSSIGAFGALYTLDNDTVISTTTDGVGTKLLVAQMAKKHDTVGIDLVAMNVNDIVAMGSKPLLFLDYIAYSDLEDAHLEQILSGIVEALGEAGAILAGGETAQMPDVYPSGAYDLAGFCVGISRKDELLLETPEPGDVVVGFESSGYHSNGYSLLRKVFFEVAGYDLQDRVLDKRSLADLLLTPTKIYVKPLLSVRDLIKRAAHITGGGFYDNISRILPDGVGCVIEKRLLPERDEFELVRKLGNIAFEEMFRTFNMGVGFVVVVSPENVRRLIETVGKLGTEAFVIGQIEKGRGVRIV